MSNKIAHVTVYPSSDQKHQSGVSGVASYSHNMIEAIRNKDKKNEHIVICEKIDSHLSDENLNTHRVFNKNLLYTFQVCKKLLSIKPDIVHIQHEKSLYGGILTAYLFPLMLIFCRFFRIKSVVTIHGVVDKKIIDKKFIKEQGSSLPPFLVKIGFALMFKPIAFFANKVIVHTEYFKNSLIEGYGIDQNKIKVVPHGVEELKRIDKNKARKILNLDKNKFILLFMGYLNGYKGLDLLIEAVGEAVKSDPSVYLVVGAGMNPTLKGDENYISYYNETKQSAKKLIGEDNYNWVGFIEDKDITAYYSASDLSVFPYKQFIGASGPMAISIGYNTPYIASSAFESVVDDQDSLFSLDRESLSSKVLEMSRKNLKSAQSIDSLKWSSVSEDYISLYLDMQ